MFIFKWRFRCLCLVNRKLKQPQRQQKPHKFAYLTMKNSIFARFARAFFIFWHFKDVLVLSTTWNDLFCSCVDGVSIWWQILIFVFLCPKRWFQFNSRVVRTHFSNIMTLNKWKMITETRSYIFRWHFRFCRRRVCFSSLISCALAEPVANLLIFRGLFVLIGRIPWSDRGRVWQRLFPGTIYVVVKGKLLRKKRKCLIPSLYELSRFLVLNA